MAYQSNRAWVVAVLAVTGAFLVAGVLAALIADWLGRWNLPVSGFCAAFAVVVTAYCAAPVRRLVFSGAVFVLGCLAALWWFEDGSLYPEGYTLAYQSTYLPLWATLSGGVVGLLAVLTVHYFRGGETGPTKTMEPTR